MARYIPGKGWDETPRPSRFHEIVEHGPPTCRVGKREEHGKVYYSQLAEHPNDKRAWLTHDEARRVCDKKGYAYSPMPKD